MPAQHRPELEDILSEKLLAVEAMGDRRIDDDDTELIEALPGFCVECKDQEVINAQILANCAYISLTNLLSQGIRALSTMQRRFL
jgi:hypothetical protein